MKLHRLINSDTWSLTDAEAWWSRHERDPDNRNPTKDSLTRTSTLSSDDNTRSTKAPPFDQTMDHIPSPKND
jgi:hypothetical protein